MYYSNNKKILHTYPFIVPFNVVKHLENRFIPVIANVIATVSSLFPTSLFFYSMEVAKAKKKQLVMLQSSHGLPS